MANGQISPQVLDLIVELLHGTRLRQILVLKLHSWQSQIVGFMSQFRPHCLPYWQASRTSLAVHSPWSSRLEPLSRAGTGSTNLGGRKYDYLLETWQDICPGYHPRSKTGSLNITSHPLALVAFIRLDLLPLKSSYCTWRSYVIGVGNGNEDCTKATNCSAVADWILFAESLTQNSDTCIDTETYNLGANSVAHRNLDIRKQYVLALPILFYLQTI